jgi:hypothetical protein
LVHPREVQALDVRGRNLRQRAVACAGVAAIGQVVVRLFAALSNRSLGHGGLRVRNSDTRPHDGDAECGEHPRRRMVIDLSREADTTRHRPFAFVSSMSYDGMSTWLATL